MAKLGTLTLFVESEKYSDSVEATAYPVEKGVAFTDHVKRNPKTVSLQVFMQGSQASKNLASLQAQMNKGTILKYVGRETASNVIILSLDHPRDASIKNGFMLDIQLREVRIVKSPWVKAPKKQKATRKPMDATGKKKPVSKKSRPTTERYHIVKAGDTFWALSRKYGTSIQQLRNFNKYPDRNIPIGVKLRVK